MKQKSTNDKTRLLCRLFLADVAYNYTKLGAHLILTMDETFWPLLPQQQSLVHVMYNDARPASKVDPKSGITLAVTVAADGTRLPLYVIGKGDTAGCLAKYKVPDDHVAAYSQRGWMTEELMLDFLDRIIEPYSPHESVCLILDALPAHKTAAVRAKAKRLGIRLIFVPATMTATLSPLDVGVNAVLKQAYSRLWRQMRLFGENNGIETALPWASAVKFAVDSYNLIRPHVIESAFSDGVNVPLQQPRTLPDLRAEYTRIKNLIADGHIVEPPANQQASRGSDRLPHPPVDQECINDRIIALLLAADEAQ